MKECKKCKAVIEDKCTYCPKCGTLVKEDSSFGNQFDANLRYEAEIPRKLTEDEHRILRNKHYLAIGLGLFIAVAPFFINGFHFGFFWYLIIGIDLYLTYEEIHVKYVTNHDGGELMMTFLIYIAIAIVMYIWGPLNPDYK